MVAITTTKTNKRIFSDKTFYVNNIICFHLDKNLYLFKKGLINKINATSLEQLIKLGLEVSKEILINNIKELTMMMIER